MTSLEWEMMRAISDVQHNQKALASIVEGFNFTGYSQAQSFALNAFELTVENVKSHIAAAIKIASFSECSDLRSAYRLTMLRSMTEAIAGNTIGVEWHGDARLSRTVPLRLLLRCAVMCSHEWEKLLAFQFRSCSTAVKGASRVNAVIFDRVLYSWQN